MRANPLQMRLADAVNPYLDVRYDAALDGAPPVSPPCFANADCSSADVARADLYDIERQVSAGMPGGKLVICRDASAWDAAAHAPRWACDNAADGPVVIKLGWHVKLPDGAEPDGPQTLPRVMLNLRAVPR